MSVMAPSHVSDLPKSLLPKVFIPQPQHNQENGGNG